MAALIKQACPRLTPAQVRSIMVSTARDVTAGSVGPPHNHPAGPGADLATGTGLVDAHRAVLVAKLRVPAPALPAAAAPRRSADAGVPSDLPGQAAAPAR